MLGYLMAKLGLLCVQSVIEVLCTAWIHVGILVMAAAKVGSAAAAGKHFVTLRYADAAISIRGSFDAPRR
jgi:hypothetical protein